VPTNAIDTLVRRHVLNQFDAQSSVIPFAMIMGDKLRDSPSKMALAERNQPTETFLFDRCGRSVRRGRSRSAPETASG